MSRLLATALLLLSSTALGEGTIRRCDERGLNLEAATLSQAQRLFRDGKPRDAQCLLEVVTRRAPADAEAWYWLALSATEVGRTGRAAHAAARALELNPHHGESWVIAGFVAQSRGALFEARSLYQRFLVEHPDAPEAEEIRSVVAQLPPAEQKVALR